MIRKIAETVNEAEGGIECEFCQCMYVAFIRDIGWFCLECNNIQKKTSKLDTEHIETKVKDVIAYLIQKGTINIPEVSKKNVLAKEVEMECRRRMQYSYEVIVNVITEVMKKL